METLISVIADWLVLPIVAVASAALLYFVPNRKKVATYGRLLVAGLSSYMVAKFMALAYQPSEARPFEVAGVDPGASFMDNPGFPSDHTLFVWVIVFAVWYGTRKWWLVVLLAAAALAVSLGRVAALVHAPIDIIGGFVAAALGALWYLDALQYGKRKTLQKSQK